LFAWAARLADRLAEANRRAEAEAEAADGSCGAGGAQAAGRPGVALVLAARRDAVDDFVRRAYPRLGTGRAPGGRASRSGYAAGRAAADRADLGTRPLPGAPRAIPA